MRNFKNGFMVVICGLVLTLGLTPLAWGQDAQLSHFQALEGKIDIAGGTAHIPVIKEAAEQTMKVNPKIRITVAGGGLLFPQKSPSMG